MTGSCGTTRKKRRFSDMDDSQKTIESFCVRKKDRKNANKSQHKLSCGQSVCEISPRKKQTLLAPFDKTNYPNCFKIKKMDCSEVVRSKSHKRSKQRNGDNVRSIANDILTQTETLGGTSISEEREFELEAIECCERAESLSQEKLKHRDVHINSNSNYDTNLSQVHSIANDILTQTETLGGTSISEEREFELEAIECCERAESLSQEKLKHRDVHINSNSNYDTNLSQVHTITHTTSSNSELEETEHEAEIIECCERAELSVSQENVRQRKTRNSSSNSPNMFGLLGITSSDEDELGLCFDEEMENYQLKSYFDELPDEILENVFCHLPLVDLLMNLSLVCKRWYGIISSEKFLLWKKRYYSYKQCFESREEINEIMVQEQLHIPQEFPTNLCR